MLTVKLVDYGLLAIIFLLRFAAIALPGNLLQTDPDGYLRLANALVQSGVYGLIDEAGIPHATAFRPPLYPLLLAATLWCTGSPSLWAIAALHAGLATLSAAFVLSIGRTLHLRFTLATCVLFSIDPLLVRQSQLIMTETAATTLGLFSWWLLMKQEQLRAPKEPSTLPPIATWALTLSTGISFGVATLTRPTAIVWFALVLLFYAIKKTPRRSALLRQAAWMCFGFAITLTPWIARNREHFGKSIWATTHGGYTLLLANNPILYDHFAQGSLSRNWDEDLFHRLWARRKSHDPHQADFWNAAHDAAAPTRDNNTPLVKSVEHSQMNYGQRHREVVEDELAQSIAIETIRQRPLMFAWAAIVRVGWLWTPLPNPRPDSWIKWPIATWYLALYVLAMTGAWRLGRKNLETGWILGWLLLISLTLVHAVYWSNMRMRAPALPLLYLLAAQSADWLTHKLTNTARKPPPIEVNP